MRFIKAIIARAPRMLATLVVRVVFFALASRTCRIVPVLLKGEFSSQEGVEGSLIWG